MRRWHKQIEDEDRVPREMAQSPTWGQPSIIVSLDISNFGEDPDEITRILGIIPTSSGRRGEFPVRSDGRRSKRARRLPGWSVQLDNIHEMPMSVHLRALVGITSQCNSWNQLPADSRVQVRGTIIWGVKNPKLVVPSDCLAEFARIGADFNWWRLRITGDTRTKYHKLRDKKVSS